MKYPRKNTWALLADGGNATIIKNLTLQSFDGIINRETTHPDISDIMSDRAGRTFSSNGSGRSAMELHSDPVRENEIAFAKELLAELDQYYRDDQLQQLIVIAAPRTLGDIRQHMPAELKDIVVFESDKNLTHLPQEKLVFTINKLREK